MPKQRGQVKQLHRVGFCRSGGRLRAASVRAPRRARSPRRPLKLSARLQAERLPVLGGGLGGSRARARARLPRRSGASFCWVLRMKCSLKDRCRSYDPSCSGSLFRKGKSKTFTGKMCQRSGRLETLAALHRHLGVVSRRAKRTSSTSSHRGRSDVPQTHTQASRGLWWFSEGPGNLRCQRQPEELIHAGAQVALPDAETRGGGRKCKSCKS